MDNRMNILQKALQLFYEKGYDAIGVQEIADAAGVTKPTLYHYFGSKYGLLEAVAREDYVQLRDGLAVRAEYAGDLPMNLERLTKFYLDFCSSHEAYYKLMMAMMYSAKESDTYKVIYPCMQEIIRMLTDMFLKAGDIIGYVGTSAKLECAEGPHLHFELTVNGSLIDSYKELKLVNG